jgi:lysophospholipase L1-like esterase
MTIKLQKPLAALAVIASAFISACSNTPSKESLVIEKPASDKHIAIMGRTQSNDDKSLTFAYPGVTLSMDVVGSELNMEAQSSGDNSYLDVIVDQQARIVKLSNKRQTIKLFKSPTAGSHKVEIVHRSETWHGQVTISQFTLTGGKFLAAPKLAKRKILVLGDSVTCGEAIDRVAGETKNPRWWNARHSYGMLTANKLNAQVQLVCYGGRGLIRSWNGKTDDLNLPDFYPLTIADPQHPISWDKSNYKPDLIVSAIGTNDFSQGIPAHEAYVAAYVKFINRLLVDYPHAKIAVTEGAILNGDGKTAMIEYLTETLNRVNNPKVYRVLSNYYPGDAIDAHPTDEQHADMANDLAPQLKAIMNWQ